MFLIYTQLFEYTYANYNGMCGTGISFSSVYCTCGRNRLASQRKIGRHTYSLLYNLSTNSNKDACLPISSQSWGLPTFLIFAHVWWMITVSSKLTLDVGISRNYFWCSRLLVTLLVSHTRVNRYAYICGVRESGCICVESHNLYIFRGKLRQFGWAQLYSPW